MVAAWIRADDGRRAGHRVGQPDVQRDLGRLARRHPRKKKSVIAVTAAASRRSVVRRELEDDPGCPAFPELARTYSKNIAIRKPKSPIRLTMNAFWPASGLFRCLIPEPDQQVRAEPDAFPADEHQRVVRAQDEDQHEEDEQV